MVLKQLHASTRCVAQPEDKFTPWSSHRVHTVCTLSEYQPFAPYCASKSFWQTPTLPITLSPTTRWTPSVDDTLLCPTFYSLEDSSILVSMASVSDFLPRTDQIAACQVLLKTTPGWRVVRQMTEMQIMAPSRIMKVTCWLASFPRNPPDNSAHRKTDRMNMVRVATPSDQRKIWKRLPLLRSWKSGLSSLGAARWTLQAYSAERRAKRAREKTCQLTPATMMSLPILSSDELLFAPDAIPPPAACNRRAKKSNVIKSKVYVLGLKKETCSEYTTTIRDRHR